MHGFRAVDQVKQQVWIAKGLIDQYGDIVRRYVQAWKDDNDAEQHVLHGELERIYPAIWEHLDSAAKLTQSTGRTTEGYSGLRSRSDLVTSNAVASVSSQVVGVTHLATKTVITSELKMRHNEEGPAPDVDLRGGFFSKLFRRFTGG